MSQSDPDYCAICALGASLRQSFGDAHRRHHRGKLHAFAQELGQHEVLRRCAVGGTECNLVAHVTKELAGEGCESEGYCRSWD